MCELVVLRDNEKIRLPYREGTKLERGDVLLYIDYNNLFDLGYGTIDGKTNNE